MAQPSTSAQPKPHYFYTNYHLSNSAVQLRSKIESYVRPAREPIPRTYSSALTEYQESMARGLQLKYPGMRSRPESAPRQRRSGKKLFDGTPPSVEYKLKKRERLLTSNAQTVGADKRWSWDKAKPPPQPNDAPRVRPTPAPLSSSHPNSMDSIVSNWRERLVQTRQDEPVHYHRKNLFSRQTFIDGTAEMRHLLHDYPIEPLDLTPHSCDYDNYKPG